MRIALRIWVALVLLFLFVPIAAIVLYSFNRSNIETWPISGFSLPWLTVAWHDSQARGAFLLSARLGLLTTAVALLPGSAVPYALHQFRLFRRDATPLRL